MPSTRRTFVIDVRELGGPATLHEVRTGRKARLGSLRDAGAQIERWLREARPPTTDRPEGPA